MKTLKYCGKGRLQAIFKGTICTLLFLSSFSAWGQITQAEKPVLRKVFPGDRIKLIVAEQTDLNESYPVAGDGTILLPELGRVSVANRTLTEASLAITQYLEERYFRRATVTVDIDQFVSGKIQVYGAVKSGAVIDASDGRVVSLFEAIIEAGGLTSRAEGDNVKILRWRPGGGMQREIITVDVREMMRNLNFNKDEWLQPRDMVYVPSASSMDSEGREVLLFGEVGSVGYHPYFEGLSVLRLIANTGGLPNTAQPNAARILRLTPAGDYTVIPVDISAILGNAQMEKNIDMEPGDILYVPAATYAKAGQVFVLGEAKNRGPFPLPLNRDMGVADLMLRVESTQFSNLSKVKLIREAPDGSKRNISVDAKRILDTGNFEQDIPLQDGDIIIIPGKIINI